MEERESLLWARLRAATRARIGLGRAGCGQPTKAMLDFQLGFAQARDAVHRPLDVARLQQILTPMPSLSVCSRAQDRATYLRRPDLGRCLSPDSRSLLDQMAGGTRPVDVAFVIGDGLSAAAAAAWAPDLIFACREQLGELRVAPIVIATQARVALADEIGEVLGARCVLMLLGERPGLSVPDSLGVYITWAPRVGTPDSLRNCISNIHRDGLSPALAAAKAAWLVREAIRRKLTGVALKEDLAGQRPLLT